MNAQQQEKEGKEVKQNLNNCRKNEKKNKWRGEGQEGEGLFKVDDWGVCVCVCPYSLCVCALHQASDLERVLTPFLLLGGVLR